ncbi:hypothetical protein GF322_00965 [Candidatus Dependentiae bacterium]|nr:hypothetical protein [Candidatus Dependentiae bacterium]
MQSSLLLTKTNNTKIPSHIINKYPILMPLICLISGIFWQNKLPINQCLLIITILSLFALLIKKIYQRELICLLCFFSGAFLLQNHQNNYALLLNKLNNKKIDIIATIENKEHIPNNQYSEIIKLKISKIKTPNDISYLPINFNILCYLKNSTNIEIDDKIEIKSICFKKPSINKKTLTNNPNFQTYLLKENILTTIFLQKLIYKKIYSPNFSFNKWIWAKKQELFNHLKIKLQADTFSFFSLIFLGNKSEKNLSLKKQFNNWGISHYLARSGLHIMLFILIWKFLFCLIPLAIQIKQIILISICTSYQFLSWTSISFVRAFYVFIFYEIGKLINQQTNLLHILNIICFYILLINPTQLFFIDFQLSFALTYALIFFNQFAKNKI